MPDFLWSPPAELAVLIEPHELEDLSGTAPYGRERGRHPSSTDRRRRPGRGRLAVRGRGQQALPLRAQRSLLDLCGTCETRGLVAYGLGTGEVGVCRGEIPLLAARSHPRGPQDIAPAGYNTDAPDSLFDLASAPIGRRRSATRSRRSR
jgi:hypothetical protein